MNSFDAQFFLFLNQRHNEILDFLTVGLSWLTEGALLWLFICFVLLLINDLERKRKIVLIFANLILSSWIINVFLKMFFFRARPYETLEGARALGQLWANSSFPSGHMTSAVASLVMIFYLFKISRRWLAPAIMLVIFLGYARIYTGMHYFSDVIGGVLLGLCSSVLIIWLDKQIKFLNNKNI